MTTRFADDETLAHIAKLERELAEATNAMRLRMMQITDVKEQLAECQRPC